MVRNPCANATSVEFCKLAWRPILGEERGDLSLSLSVSLPNALIGVRDKSGLGNGRSASFALVAAAAVVACPVVFAVVARVNQDGR